MTSTSRERDASSSPAAPASSAATSATACSRRAIACSRSTTSRPATRAHRPPRRRTALPLHRAHDIAARCRRRRATAARIFNLACPASPAYYQRQPVQTTLTSVLGTWRLLEMRRAQRRAAAAGVDERGLRRPARCIRSPSPTGATSIRSARARATTKASAAPRRCASPTAASAALAIRVAASSTATARACAGRRPRRQQLHRPGAARRAAHGLRRRPADAQLLLRRRHGRRRCCS